MRHKFLKNFIVWWQRWQLPLEDHHKNHWLQEILAQQDFVYELHWSKWVDSPNIDIFSFGGNWNQQKTDSDYSFKKRVGGWITFAVWGTSLVTFWQEIRGPKILQKLPRHMDYQGFPLLILWPPDTRSKCKCIFMNPAPCLWIFGISWTYL